MSEKGWLTKQFEQVERDVKQWPDWMLGSGKNCSDSQRDKSQSGNKPSHKAQNQEDKTIASAS